MKNRIYDQSLKV